MTEARARSLRRLMLLTLGISGVMVLLAVLLATNDYEAYAVVVVGIVLVFTSSATLTLRALRERGPAARRGSILTGVFLVVLSVPLISIYVGLATALTGLGVLFVALSREREA